MLRFILWHIVKKGLWPLTHVLHLVCPYSLTQPLPPQRWHFYKFISRALLWHMVKKACDHLMLSTCGYPSAPATMISQRYISKFCRLLSCDVSLERLVTTYSHYAAHIYYLWRVKFLFSYLQSLKFHPCSLPSHQIVFDKQLF